jgi:putative hydrolase of the HAD superfamily
MNRKRYKHLFFDLDNTLFDFDASALLALKECFVKHNLNKWFSGFDEFFEAYSPINSELWDKYKHNLLSKDDVKYGRFRLTLKTKEIEDEQLVHSIAEDFLQFSLEKNMLVEGALPVIKELYSRYSLHIISNGFTEVQHRKMELTGLSPYFKKIILSEQVKAQKPSRTIFEYAVKSANARKVESIMIGDNIEADILGAKNFGIDQIYCDYSKSPENRSKATFDIEKIDELLQLL